MKLANAVCLSLEDVRTAQSAFDVFICSASYEERCRSVADAIADNRDVRQRFVCFNQRSSAAVTQNARFLMERLGSQAVGIALDKASPLTTADNLQKALSRIGADERPLSFLVDITTFTHEALLILLRVLQPRVAKSMVVLAYSPAEEYSVGLMDEQKWLSKGITDIRSVLGYPGDGKPSKKAHLVVLVGFESDRAERLIDDFQPHVISLGFCHVGTSTALQHEQINRRAFQRLAAKVSRYNEFEFSCTDIDDVMQAVAYQANLYPDCNVVVAPMNTKLSTVGVAAAAFRDERIQLCYASASQYNVDAYSRPGKDCILTTLHADFWRPSA